MNASSPGNKQHPAPSRADPQGATFTPRGPLGHTPPDTTSAGIPRSLAPFFQEYDLERLDTTEHSSLIVELTLAYGDRADRDLQPDLLIETLWPEIRRFFVTQARTLGQSWFGQ